MTAKEFITNKINSLIEQIEYYKSEYDKFSELAAQELQYIEDAKKLIDELNMISFEEITKIEKGD